MKYQVITRFPNLTEHTYNIAKRYTNLDVRLRDGKYSHEETGELRGRTTAEILAAVSVYQEDMRKLLAWAGIKVEVQIVL